MASELLALSQDICVVFWVNIMSGCLKDFSEEKKQKSEIIFVTFEEPTKNKEWKLNFKKLSLVTTSGIRTRGIAMSHGKEIQPRRKWK